MARNFYRSMVTSRLWGTLDKFLTEDSRTISRTGIEAVVSTVQFQFAWLITLNIFFFNVTFHFQHMTTLWKGLFDLEHIIKHGVVGSNIKLKTSLRNYLIKMFIAGLGLNSVNSEEGLSKNWNIKCHVNSCFLCFP